MALSTLPKLRETAEQALVEAGYRPEIAAEQMKNHGKIEELLAKRAVIDDLLSGKSQKEAYGIEQFTNDFVTLSSLERHSDCAYEGVHLQNYIWSRVPHCPFKRFQESFCCPDQFVVPPFQLQKPNRVNFRAGMNFQTMSLRGCVVSPERISDTFAKRSGLCNFDDTDTPLTRLQKKNDAIPALKLMFASAEPLQRGNQRLLRVIIPSAECAQEYEASVPTSAVGTILHTRENGARQHEEKRSGKRMPQKPRTLVPSCFQSAYAALRKTAHERKGYDIEQLELVRLREELRRLVHRFDMEWATKKERLIAEAYDIIERGHASLEHAISPDKVKAHSRLQRSSELLQKPNSSAAMATFVGALNDLEKRIDRFVPIEGHNEEDRLVLQRNIVREEIGIKDVRRSVEDAAEVYQDEPSIRTPWKLGIDERTLKHLSLQPFTTFAGRMLEKLVILKKAVSEQRTEDAQAALIQMHIIGKFQAIRTCFEHIKFWLANEQSIPIEQIRQFVGKLNNIIAGHQIYPDINVEGYEQPFQEIQQKIREIEQKLSQYAEKSMPPEEHLAMEQRLRKYLDTFDLEEIVRRLP